MEDDGPRMVHSYRNIIASDNARVHNGDVYTTGPVTVVTTEGKVSNVIDMLNKTTLQVHAIQHERHNIDYTLLNLVSQLMALKIALEVIGKWAKADAAETHHQLQMDLDRCLTGCRSLVARLDQVTEHIQNCLSNRDLAPSVVETTISSALAEAEEIQKYIATQINAMNLLLTAFQCNTIAGQNVVLQKRSARKIIRSIEKDTASLLVHTGDVPSSWKSIADAGSNLSIVFPFDQELWTTKVYSRLSRQLLKKVIRRTDHWPVQLSEIRPGLPDDTHNSRKDIADAKLKQRSRSIEKALRAERRRRDRGYKLLVFGNSTDDKELLMKQLKIVFGDGHSTAELAAYQQSILLHLVTCAKALSHAMAKLDIALEDTVLRRLIMDSEDSIGSEVISAVVKLCREANVHSILERQEEMVLPRFAAYFLIAAERMTTADYLPTEADVLRITSGRTGLYEETFVANKQQTHVTVLDHPAQMPRNMLQLFSHNTTPTVFLADLAEYDTSAFENASQNGLLESLLLFEEITKSRLPQHFTILVLLTNVDSFNRKLISKPLEQYFQDYTGGNDPNRAVEYVSRRFDQLSLLSQATFIEFGNLFLMGTLGQIGVI
ncbi:Guanine nucleotide-binding protein alpha-2 subunit [Elasticomyces elasticus]|nr:Guanine nucleotide-binding protein alpha-2 subunit [Elasticomyces elasticus]